MSFIPPASEWVSTGSMVNGRTWHKATRLADGKVLIAGGGELAAVTYDTAQLYDPASGTFDNTASMAARRILFTLTLLGNGKALAAGGRTYNDNIFLSSAELFDPDAGTFSLRQSRWGPPGGCTRPPFFRTARS